MVVHKHWIMDLMPQIVGDHADALLCDRHPSRLLLGEGGGGALVNLLLSVERGCRASQHFLHLLGNPFTGTLKGPWLACLSVSSPLLVSTAKAGFSH